jgi:hypothetical protein
MLVIFIFDRETAEPALLLTNLKLTSDSDAENIMKMFSAIDPVHYFVRNCNEMVIAFRQEHDADIALQMAYKIKVGDRPIGAEKFSIQDIGIVLLLSAKWSMNLFFIL